MVWLDRFCSFEVPHIAAEPQMYLWVYCPGDADLVTTLIEVDALINISLTHLHKPLPLRPQWALWRQDDNGNEFRISWHLSEAGAERALRWMTRFKHKQTYWTQHEPR
ncbi:MAG: hypothetical protein ACI8RZ_003003 [Myxococcota bacterium]